MRLEEIATGDKMLLGSAISFGKLEEMKERRVAEVWRMRGRTSKWDIIRTMSGLSDQLRRLGANRKSLAESGLIRRGGPTSH